MTRAFTLIELLVVVTIIVVLLSLLAPSLDRAIYQAELVVCAARLDGIASGADAYAMAHQRNYPYRPGARGGAWQPNLMADGNNKDDRPMLKPFIPIELLADPLTGGIDLVNTITPDIVYTNYSLWFGFQFKGYNGMLRLGSRLAFAGTEFDVMATDADVIQVNARHAHGSHPDDRNKTVLEFLQNSTYGTAGGKTLTASNWHTDQRGADRGGIDTNHAFADGSVRRVLSVQWNETEPGRGHRMMRVPLVANDADTTAAWRHLPVR